MLARTSRRVLSAKLPSPTMSRLGTGFALKSKFDLAATPKLHKSERTFKTTAPRLNALKSETKAPSGEAKFDMSAMAEREYNLGRRYELQDGVALNLPKAFEHYERALVLGHPPAMLKVGLFYCDGFDVVKIDDDRAFSLFKRASELKVPGSNYWYGLFLLNGFGCEKNEAAGRALWQQDAQDPYCVLGLCAIDASAAVPADVVDKLVKLAERGDVEAPFLLAFAYQNGRGVPQDFAKGFKYATIAAQRNHATAQNNLAWCWQHGHGTDKDEKKAFALYTKAAQQGERNAMFNLSVCYQHGLGVARDAALAVHWRFRAAELGDAVAQTDLGVIYRNGLLGVDQNISKAKEWLQKAAGAGHADAINMLQKL